MTLLANNLNSEFVGWLAGNAITLLIIFCIIEVIGVISLWKIFKDAGRYGFSSIIPIWNNWCLIEITGASKWLIALYLFPIGKVLLDWILSYYLAKAYNKGILCMICLIIFRPFALCYLAYGSSKLSN